MKPPAFTKTVFLEIRFSLEILNQSDKYHLYSVYIYLWMTILLCSHRSIFSPFSLSGEAGPFIDPTEINGSLPSDPAALTFFSLLQNLM